MMARYLTAKREVIKGRKAGHDGKSWSMKVKLPSIEELTCCSAFSKL